MHISTSTQKLSRSPCKHTFSLPPSLYSKAFSIAMQTHFLSLLPVNAIFQHKLRSRLTGSTTCWRGGSPELWGLLRHFAGASAAKPAPGPSQATKLTVRLPGDLILHLPYRRWMRQDQDVFPLPSLFLGCSGSGTPGETQYYPTKEMGVVKTHILNPPLNHNHEERYSLQE